MKFLFALVFWLAICLIFFFIPISIVQYSERLNQQSLEESYALCKFKEGDMVILKSLGYRAMIIETTSPKTWKRDIPEYRIRILIPRVPGIPVPPTEFCDGNVFREFELEKE